MTKGKGFGRSGHKRRPSNGGKCTKRAHRSGMNAGLRENVTRPGSEHEYRTVVELQGLSGENSDRQPTKSHQNPGGTNRNIILIPGFAKFSSITGHVFGGLSLLPPVNNNASRQLRALLLASRFAKKGSSFKVTGLANSHMPLRRKKPAKTHKWNYPFLGRVSVVKVAYPQRINDTIGLPPDLYAKIRDLSSTSNVEVSQLRVDHIWQRHGCRQNAEFEQQLPRNGGKMPSYFFNSEMLAKAIASTVSRPNWTRRDFRRGFGYRLGGKQRFRGSKARSALYTHDQTTLYFKNFRQAIGCSGIGYGTGPDCDLKDCHMCCAVVSGSQSLITAFPILEKAAVNRGTGEKTPLSDKSSWIINDVKDPALQEDKNTSTSDPPRASSSIGESNNSRSDTNESHELRDNRKPTSSTPANFNDGSEQNAIELRNCSSVMQFTFSDLESARSIQDESL